MKHIPNKVHLILYFAPEDADQIGNAARAAGKTVGAFIEEAAAELYGRGVKRGPFAPKGSVPFKLSLREDILDQIQGDPAIKDWKIFYKQAVYLKIGRGADAPGTPKKTGE